MAGPVVINCIQGEREWFEARMGIPTASEFHTILGVKKDARDKKTRTDYMLKLAGEILTGEPMESYSNGNMERGKAMEGEARDLYSFMTDSEPQQVGFIRNGPKGCSPDSLIADDGMLEIKSKFPHLTLACILKDDFPPEHKAQCQGALWVAEREWIDLAVYWPKLPLFVKRATRDEAYIKDLAKAVDAFNDELAQTVEKIRRRDEPKSALTQSSAQDNHDGLRTTRRTGLPLQKQQEGERQSPAGERAGEDRLPALPEELPRLAVGMDQANQGRRSVAIAFHTGSGRQVGTG